MSKLRLRSLIAFIVGSAIVLVPSVAHGDAGSQLGESTGASEVQVLFNDKSLNLAALEGALGQTHCHDAAGVGQLTCFATEREADLDILSFGGFSVDSAGKLKEKWRISEAELSEGKSKRAHFAISFGPACRPYATGRLYSELNYGGSSVALFCRTPDLRADGFNNKAQSWRKYQDDIIYNYDGFTYTLRDWSLAAAGENMAASDRRIASSFYY